jgi:hypothetical protein
MIAALAIGVVLALDWLALDDITTGHQPGFVVEWTFIFISVPVLWILRKHLRKRGPDERTA